MLQTTQGCTRVFFPSFGVAVLPFNTKIFGGTQMNLSLDTLNNANRIRNREAFPECSKWGLIDWMLALCGEVGEVANATKHHRTKPTNTTVQDIASELADVVIYADILCDVLGGDLGKSLGTVMHSRHRVHQGPKCVDAIHDLDALREYTIRTAKWNLEKFVGLHNTTTHNVSRMVIWAGRLASEMDHCLDTTINTDPPGMTQREALACLVARIVIHADLVAYLLGLSLGECVVTKFNHVSIKKDTYVRLD